MRKEYLRHFRLGYLEQVGAFVTLALVNLALPNLLRVQEFANFNMIFAFSMPVSGVLGEGFTMFLVSQIRQQELGDEEVFPFLVPLLVPFLGVVALALVALLVLAGGGGASHSLPFMTLGLSVTVLATGILNAFYLAMVAVFVATLRNQFVLRLSLTNVSLYFMSPLILAKLGWGLHFAPLVIYSIGSLVALGLVRREGIPMTVRGLRFDGSLFRQFRSISASLMPSAFRNFLIWVPVLWLGVSGFKEAGASYKIAISICLGSLSLVPFPRWTMLSLLTPQGTWVSDDMGPRIRFAQLVAAFGTMLLHALAGPISNYLYRGRYQWLEGSLERIAPALLVILWMDVLVLRMVAAGRLRQMNLLHLTALAATLPLLPQGHAHWLPLVAGGTMVIVGGLLAPSFIKDSLSEIGTYGGALGAYFFLHRMWGFGVAIPGFIGLLLVFDPTTRNLVKTAPNWFKGRLHA